MGVLSAGALLPDLGCSLCVAVLCCWSLLVDQLSLLDCAFWVPAVHCNFVLIRASLGSTCGVVSHV